MVRAAGGELDQSGRQVIADHLVVCSNCAEEYRLLRRLKLLIEQAAVLPFENNSVIEPVAGNQDQGARVVPPQPGFPRRGISVFFPGIAAYVAVAASLVIGLACAALIISLRRQNAELSAQLKEQMSRRDQSSQSVAETSHQLAETRRLAERRQQKITELRRSLEDLSRPQVDAPIIDLDMQNDRSAVDRAVRTVNVPKGVTLFTVILHVDKESSYSEYALEILDEQGRQVRRVSGLYRSPEDTFIVTLSRRLLPAGRYRLRLHGLYAGGSKAVGDYQIRVRYL
ncbi:MAG: hypothetical protein ACREA2_15050 [Blastocatellia bacterium]